MKGVNGWPFWGGFKKRRVISFKKRRVSGSVQGSGSIKEVAVACWTMAEASGVLLNRGGRGGLTYERDRDARRNTLN